ncbi:hypothetical protein TNCV_2631101 [Trichonephila clavipes]|nr:hypothetical protein TNCV_2631101 [Trichonephila clavipes]
MMKRGYPKPMGYHNLQTVYEEEIMSRQMFGRLCCMFSERRQNVEDEGRSGNHGVNVAYTKCIGAHAYHMLHNVLSYRKVSLR